jgi:hypothetical protein
VCHLVKHLVCMRSSAQARWRTGCAEDGTDGELKVEEGRDLLRVGIDRNEGFVSARTLGSITGALAGKIRRDQDTQETRSFLLRGPLPRWVATPFRCSACCCYEKSLSPC